MISDDSACHTKPTDHEPTHTQKPETTKQGVYCIC